MQLKYTAQLVMLISVGFVGSLQAQLTFQFSDNGSNTTLITASGTATLTGGQGALGALVTRIGWDDISTPGTNHSFYLVADSDFFTFNEPNVGGGFNQFTLSGGDLAIGGIALAFLEMDGTDSPDPYPYFALNFDSALPQTGTVEASGSAVVNFDFLGLPYFGQSFDLQGTGDVVFSFDAIPEPTTVSLLGISALAGIMLKRHRSRTNKKDVIPSEGMVEKW